MTQHTPKHWKRSRADALVREVKATVQASELSGKEVFHYSIPVVQELGDGRVESGDDIDSSKSLIDRQVLLVSKLNPRKSTVLIAHPREITTVCSGEFVPLEATGCDCRYLFYVFLSEPTRQQLSAAVQSVTRSHQRVDPAMVRKLWWTWPPLDEQRAIAAFLDRETTKIDELIEKKVRLCELLDERLHSLICRVVTSGLNANVDTRQSRIPWLLSYPAHWRVVALSWFSRVSNGSTPSQGNPEYWQDGDVPWVSSGEVNQYRITAPTALITQAALRDCSVRIIPRGAVLIGMVGQGRTRGMTSILDIDACINQNVAAIEPCADLDSEFLQFALMQAYEPIRQYGRGGRQEALNCRLVGAIRIALPPLTEQLKIASYIKMQRERILGLKEHLHQHNSRLREYRSALISAAVTGQIDVRNHRAEVSA